MFTIATIRDGRENLPEAYRTFVIKRDGVPYGTLAKVYRPKNAGGPAWRGQLIGDGTISSNVVVYSKDKAKVLAWFKGGTAPA